MLAGRRRGARSALLFAGPAVIASIAYMDPGNFATNIQAGAGFGYTLLWVVVAANLIAMLFRALAAKLGIVTGRNLAEMCRERLPRRTVCAMWAISEMAAMATDLATVADTNDVLFDRHVAVNLKGTFNTLREATRRLRPGGRIINLSSSQVGLLHPTYGVYAATKAAVEVMTRVLAKELRGRNITANAVAPGPTATALFLDGKPQEVIDRFTKLAPLERLGKPEDVANAVAFLAGSDGAWINGQVLRANDGMI